ncbi:uncharacterized protein LOC120839895 [Ixodes scapularis]|uniref:uncharacterized protein LOC120839895 n=1 Tax=Ixodes scapularis TaxID=6945 RepID=UPI001A9E2069|nr:uncharacterized protein LOC120839895 [Ixodes scapularis]
MQSAINKIQAFLENQDLSISGHKAAAMVFPGRNRRLREVKLQLDSQPLRLVSKHRFLGITLQNRCKWHDQIKAVTASTISSRNAVRRVGGQNWGNSPRSMLTLHSSLVVSRLMYSLPYMDLLPSQADKLERLHRAGLRTSLGVPRSAKNQRVYEEARSLPLHLQASQRLLLQVIRLGETHPGQSLIKRLRTRTQSKFSLATKTLAALGWEPPQIINPHGTTPPWEAGLQLAELLPGVRKKANTPPLVLKAAAQEQLAARYPRHLHIYTDGSVDRFRQSSTAAYHIPDLQKDWSARTTHMVSSTTAELLAIAEALTATKSLPPQQIVVLTDSRGGIQRIRKPGPCPTANEVRRVVRQLEEHGHSISLQWVPSHVGLRGNEIVDCLALRAHDLSPTLRAPSDPKRYQQAIQAFFLDLSPWSSSKRPPCLTQGLKRSDATLLFRPRTGSAYTGRLLTGLDAETLRSVSGVRSPRTRFT